MGKTVYEKTSEGGMCFKSERWSGDVRILNYVYDLWLPLLGVTAIGVYSVYCRLERQGTVKGKTLQDIANACRIGRDRLTKINLQLKKFGFIKTEKPDGWKRLAHWTTTITVLDPPSEVPPEAIKGLAHPQGYEPLTPWLVKKLVAPEVPDKPPEVPDKAPKEVPTGTPKIASSILNPLSLHGANAPAQPAPPVAAKPSKKKKPPTPKGVKVFRENAHRYPAKAWYDDIAAQVGEEPTALDLWGKVVKAYVGLGWNPTNVKVMLEYFGRNEIPSGNGRGQPASPAPHAGVLEWLEVQRVEAR